MTNYANTGTRGDLLAYASGNSTIIPVTKQADTGTVFTGVVIPSAGTYYFPLGGEESPLPVETSTLALSLRWAAAVAGTATIEVSNFPLSRDGAGNPGPTGTPDVADWDANTTGNWVTYNPAATGSTYSAASGTGNSVSALTLTLGGTNAGGAALQFPGNGFRRSRVKLVATVGGIIRINVHGKGL